MNELAAEVQYRRRGGTILTSEQSEQHLSAAETTEADSRRPSASLFILASLACIYLLRSAQDLFVPVVLSALIAFALDPVVALLQRLKIPRTVASALVLLGLLAGTGGGFYALRYQVTDVLETLPEATQHLREQLQFLKRAPADANGTIGKLQKAATELEKTVAEATGETKTPPRGVTRVQIDDPTFRANNMLWSGSLGFLSLLSQFVMVAFLVFFILASGDLFKRKMVRAIGTTFYEKRLTVDALNEIKSQIERFLLIQIFTSMIVGVFTALALWAFGVNQPVVWGLAAGLFNSIPYFGAIIVTAGLALVAFLQFGSVAVALKIAGVALAITSLEGYLLTPALMGRAARINGVAMFLGLLFWSWLWGVIGMIVAVPIMMVVKTVCDRIEHLQPIGELLGER
ncbi:MAG: AI-2E family transporter [Acidobacteriota bacterium]